MGFLGEFAYGFEQTAKPIIQAKEEAQAKADAEYQLRVKSIDPEVELYQRQQDILAAEDVKKRQQEMDNTMHALYGASPALQQDMGISSPPASPSAIQDTTSAPNMAPTSQQPFAAAPAQTITAPAEPDHNALYNEYKVLQANSLAYGDTHSAELWGVQAERHKTLSEQKDRLDKKEPVPEKSAEGTNVNQELVKDAKENEKTLGDSFYLPAEISQVATPSDNYKGDSYYAETVHTPLAQAEMVHQRALDPNKPETEVFGIVKQNTLAPTSDIVTLETNDQHITPARKMKAVEDLMSYMKSTYGNDIDAAIAKDKNLQHVFNTKLLSTMTAVANQAKDASALSPGD